MRPYDMPNEDPQPRVHLKHQKARLIASEGAPSTPDALATAAGISTKEKVAAMADIAKQTALERVQESPVVETPPAGASTIVMTDVVVPQGAGHVVNTKNRDQSQAAVPTVGKQVQEGTKTFVEGLPQAPTAGELERRGQGVVDAATERGHAALTSVKHTADTAVKEIKDRLGVAPEEGLAPGVVRRVQEAAQVVPDAASRAAGAFTGVVEGTAEAAGQAAASAAGAAMGTAAGAATSAAKYTTAARDSALAIAKPQVESVMTALWQLRDAFFALIFMIIASGQETWHRTYSSASYAVGAFAGATESVVGTMADREAFHRGRDTWAKPVDMKAVRFEVDRRAGALVQGAKQNLHEAVSTIAGTGKEQQSSESMGYGHGLVENLDSVRPSSTETTEHAPAGEAGGPYPGSKATESSKPIKELAAKVQRVTVEVVAPYRETFASSYEESKRKTEERVDTAVDQATNAVKASTLQTQETANNLVEGVKQTPAAAAGAANEALEIIQENAEDVGEEASKTAKKAGYRAAGAADWAVDAAKPTAQSGRQSIGTTKIQGLSGEGSTKNVEENSGMAVESARGQKQTHVLAVAEDRPSGDINVAVSPPVTTSKTMAVPQGAGESLQSTSTGMGGPKGVHGAPTITGTRPAATRRG